MRGFAMFDQVNVSGTEEDFHGLPSQTSEFLKNSEILWKHSQVAHRSCAWSRSQLEAGTGFRFVGVLAQKDSQRSRILIAERVPVDDRFDDPCLLWRDARKFKSDAIELRAFVPATAYRLG